MPDCSVKTDSQRWKDLVTAGRRPCLFGPVAVQVCVRDLGVGVPLQDIMYFATSLHGRR